MFKGFAHRIIGWLGFRIVRQNDNILLVDKEQFYLIPKIGNGEVTETEEHYILPKSRTTFAHDLLYTFHNCDFVRNPKFIASYNLGRSTDKHKTVLAQGQEIYWRLHVLCWAAAQVRHLEGDYVDCGVNTGIFARAIINYVDFAATDKKYYLLDTFTGLDARYSTAEELGQDLNYNYVANRDTLYDQVKETFEGFNVKIIKGAVPETLPEVVTDRIIFLSVDMNCVQPEIAAMEYFWDKMVTGAIIILDDYGYANSHNKQKEAHDLFAASKGVEILTLPTCQGMIIKP